MIGASTKELMNRMGNWSTSAVLGYQKPAEAHKRLRASKLQQTIEGARAWISG